MGINLKITMSGELIGRSNDLVEASCTVNWMWEKGTIR